MPNIVEVKAEIPGLALDTHMATVEARWNQ